MKKKKIITLLAILLTMFCTISLTLGKYIYNSMWDYYLSSKAFYFESDKLDINVKNNALLNWDGSDINFKITNSENNTTVSEYDITYKITCEVMGEESDYVDCVLNGTDSNVYNGTLSTESLCKNDIDSKDVSNLEKTKCEMDGYTWYNETATKNNYFNLKLINSEKNIDEVSVKITAESLTPYTKKIIGIFNLNKLEEVETEIITSYNSYDEYDELIITNLSSQNKCLEINFKSNDYVVELDDVVSKYSVDENNKINSIEVKISKQDSILKKFYKKNAAEKYSIENFDIKDKEC